MKSLDVKNKIGIAWIFATYAGAISAKNMMGAAEKLKTESTDIGLKVAAVGFAIGAVYLFLGKPEGREKISQTVWGIVCISGGSMFVEWISRILK